MEKPIIVKEVISTNKYLSLIEESKANFVSIIQYKLPDLISSTQPFDYYNVYRNFALNYCLETIVLKGVGQYSLKNDGPFIGLVRADDIVRELTRREMKVSFKFRAKTSDYISIESLLKSKPLGNYHDWINENSSYKSGLSRLTSVIFSSFVTSEKNFLDAQDMQDFVDAMSSKECKKYCYVKNTMYYYFSAENGKISITELTKKDFELNENLDEKLTYIGKVKESANGLVFKPLNRKYQHTLSESHLVLNPWN